MTRIESIKLAKICVIVNFGLASKVIKIAKENGLSGGSIMLGKGTFYRPITDLFGLNDSRKEIVWLVARAENAKKALADMRKRLKLDRKHKGIAFTTTVREVIGIRETHYLNQEEEEAVYQAIYTVVDKGKGNEVIKAATSAGAGGGTIIQGRGAGSHESSKVFGIEIEPEKEIILTLVKNEIAAAVIEAIRSELKIDEVGQGIIFVQAVSQTIGINQ